VVLDYQYGEASGMDTIQAKITYQERLIEFEQTKYDLLQSGLNLSIHLWTEDQQPLELKSTTIPDTAAVFTKSLSQAEVDEYVSWAQQNHPEILKLTGKRSQLQLENRWYKESLKPQIDLSYSFVNAPLGPSGDFTSPSFNDNYKLGLDVYFPLYLRKERGKLQKAQLKLADNAYDLTRIQLNIQNDILGKQAEIMLSETLTNEYRTMAQNYQRLLQAEFLNLETGESDLFKLNIQQDKYINSQLKFLKTSTKLQKNRAELLYEIGLPFLSLDDF
jgi:outer membrane protein TolC